MRPCVEVEVPFDFLREPLKHHNIVVQGHVEEAQMEGQRKGGGLGRRLESLVAKKARHC